MSEELNEPIAEAEEPQVEEVKPVDPAPVEAKADMPSEHFVKAKVPHFIRVSVELLDIGGETLLALDQLDKLDEHKADRKSANTGEKVYTKSQLMRFAKDSLNRLRAKFYAGL